MEMEAAALTFPCWPALRQRLPCQSVPDTPGRAGNEGSTSRTRTGLGFGFVLGFCFVFLINLMQMSSSSWLSPSLPRAPAGAGRALSGCRGSPGLLGTGRERTRSPASLFIFAVCGSVLSARLGIPAPLPPPPSSSCRAVPLRWLREKLSLVLSWGQTLGLCPAPGRGCSSSPRTGGQSWPPLLVPAWDTQHFGSCSGEARAPQLTSLAWGQWPVPFPAGAGLCW